MTESIEAPKGTVFVGRKVSDNNYGSYEFGLHLPVEFDASATVAEQSDAVQAAFKQAQEIVAAQSAPVLADIVKSDFTPKAKGAANQTAPASRELRGNQVLRTCKKEGTETPHWDNRATKTGKQPDFKCVGCGAGTWINSKPAPADEAPADEQF